MDILTFTDLVFSLTAGDLGSHLRRKSGGQPAQRGATRLLGQPRPQSVLCLEDLDVGQNGRPSKPQMWMSSLVLTIQLLGYLILTHTHLEDLDLPLLWGLAIFLVNGPVQKRLTSKAELRKVAKNMHMMALLTFPIAMLDYRRVWRLWVIEANWR